MKIIVQYVESVAFEVLNRHNSRTCGDGGGYLQWYGVVTLRTNHGLASVEVEDTSCGFFGSRVSYTLSLPDGTVWNTVRGTLFEEELQKDLLEHDETVSRALWEQYHIDWNCFTHQAWEDILSAVQYWGDWEE